MNSRRAARLGREISEIGFGAWAIGADWGKVPEDDAVAALNTALDKGVTFIDTADGYGAGRSEQIIGRTIKERSGARPFVATKCGRGHGPNTAESYNRENFGFWVDLSLKNLGVESLDLLQLHCPARAVFYMPEVFGYLDEMVAAGKVRHYGVSVEKVEDALKAIEYPGVAAIQIIYNIFRQRPARLFFREARRKGVAVIVRVPLASGLLTGKMTKDTEFGRDDHRTYNRHGEAFDVGETFAGVPYEVGLAAVEELRPLVPAGMTMAQFALRWILMDEGVTTVIPGAKNAAQAEANTAAGDMAPLDDKTMAAIRGIYDRLIAPHVDQRW